MPADRLKLFVLAGEASGDLLGGRVMSALHTQLGGDVDYIGVGGRRMSEAGLDSIFPMSELSLMGLTEVVGRIPALLRRLGQAERIIRRENPDAVLTIDAPDFSFRLQKRLKGLDTRRIHYVAPTVWAWRPGRARAVARYLDQMLCLYPFEPPYFEREGMAADFVGHSMVEDGVLGGDGVRFRTRHGLPADTRVILLLPGSRKAEVDRLMPTFVEAINRVHASQGTFHVIIPTFSSLAGQVSVVADALAPPWQLVVDDDAGKFDAFAAATAAVAASGTAGLELGMARVPTVITYRVSPTTAFLARRLIRVPWVNMVNIILDDSIVPELLQEACTPERIAGALEALLSSPEERGRQMAAGKKVAELLGAGDTPPSVRAAGAILKGLGRG